MRSDYRVPLHVRLLRRIVPRKWFYIKGKQTDYAVLGSALGKPEGQIILDYLFDNYVMVDISQRLSTNSDLNRDMLNRIDGAKRVYFDLINRLQDYDRAGRKD